jgi:hypothetical protein
VKTYRFRIRGTTPLLQHRMPEDDLFALLGAKTAKKKDKEDITPREIAEKHAYKADDGSFYVPSEYLSGAFAHVASDYKQKNSIRKSLRAVAKGVFRPTQEAYTLIHDSGTPLMHFEVDVRMAKNHKAGAVAVCRPRFDRWSIKGEVAIDDSIVSPDTVLEVLNDAGKRAGMGSYRVAKGGHFGQFQVVEFKESK